MTPNEYKEKLAALNAEFYGTSDSSSQQPKTEIYSMTYYRYFLDTALTGKIYGYNTTTYTLNQRRSESNVYICWNSQAWGQYPTGWRSCTDTFDSSGGIGARYASFYPLMRVKEG